MSSHPDRSVLPSPIALHALLALARPRRPRHRPCVGCTTPCECRRPSACRCYCGPTCLDAPVRLVPRPRGEALDADLLALGFELACVEGLELVTPPPSVEERPALAFRTDATIVADVVATVVSQRAAATESVPWKLELGLVEDSLVFVLTPARETERDVWSADARALSQNLSDALRREARKRLDATLDARGAGVTRHGLDELTQREWEVLLHFLGGEGPQSLADRLHRSAHTTRNHLKSLFDKLGVHSQSELRAVFTA